MTNKIPASQAGGYLIINLSAIVSNWELIAAKAPHAECAAVVKANAYGTGIETTVPSLAKAGCKTFFVAHLSEAKRLRAIVPHATIYVLNGFFPGTADIYHQFNLHPVIGSLSEFEEWAKFKGNTIGAALHVDTGMNRLGLTIKEFEHLHKRYEGKFPFKISLLMSHLACADDPSHPLNQEQINAFTKLRKKLPNVKASLANSAGIFLSSETHCDLIRPGYALFGGNPTDQKHNPMQHVISLYGRIIQVRDLVPNESVGYSATFVAKTPMRIACLSIGYADGFPRNGQKIKQHKPAEVIVSGHSCPLIGRVSMDLLAIDVTHVPPDRIHRGDFVEILGPHLSIHDLAEHTGTIGHEILTSLGNRFTRHIEASRNIIHAYDSEHI